MAIHFTKISTIPSFFGKISEAEAFKILTDIQKTLSISNTYGLSLIRESKDGKFLQCVLYAKSFNSF